VVLATRRRGDRVKITFLLQCIVRYWHFAPVYCNAQIRWLSSAQRTCPKAIQQVGIGVNMRHEWLGIFAAHIAALTPFPLSRFPVLIDVGFPSPRRQCDAANSLRFLAARRRGQWP